LKPKVGAVATRRLLVDATASLLLVGAVGAAGAAGAAGARSIDVTAQGGGVHAVVVVVVVVVLLVRAKADRGVLLVLLLTLLVRGTAAAAAAAVDHEGCKCGLGLFRLRAHSQGASFRENGDFFADGRFADVVLVGTAAVQPVLLLSRPATARRARPSDLLVARQAAGPAAADGAACCGRNAGPWVALSLRGIHPS